MSNPGKRRGRIGNAWIGERIRLSRSTFLSLGNCKIGRPGLAFYPLCHSLEVCSILRPLSPHSHLPRLSSHHKDLSVSFILSKLPFPSTGQNSVPVQVCLISKVFHLLTLTSRPLLPLLSSHGSTSQPHPHFTIHAYAVASFQGPTITSRLPHFALSPGAIDFVFRL